MTATPPSTRLVSARAPLSARWAKLDASTRALAILLLIGGAAMALLGALGYPTFLPYQWHLVLHILGAALFIGNIVVTALWMAFMSVGRDPETVRRAGQATQWADVAFTAPGSLLLASNGMIMVEEIGGLAAHPWVALSLALFGLTGIVWLAILIPTQQRMVTIAGEHAAAGTPLGPAFDRAFRRWAATGSLATLLPLAILVLMVLKPAIG